MNIYTVRCFFFFFLKSGSVTQMNWVNDVGHVSSPRRITLAYYSRPYRVAPSVDRDFFFCSAVALGTDARKRGRLPKHIHCKPSSFLSPRQMRKSQQGERDPI